jgi:hypothetical protein
VRRLLRSKNTLIIHSRRMAIYLQCKGFVLIGVENNLKNDKKIFLFSESQDLKKTMSQYNTDIEFHAYLEKVSGR